MIAVYAPAQKPISIRLYQQMGEKGLLTQEDRVQLIDGECSWTRASGEP